MGCTSSKPTGHHGGRMLRVAAVLMVLSGVKAEQGGGLAGVIKQLATMRNGVQVLHDEDATSYEQAACHCDEETKRLSADDGEPMGLIPQAAAELNESAAVVKERTAFIEKSHADLAVNQKELADYIKVEEDQVKAWNKRRATLNADIAEVTQAANALAAAQNFLGDHPSIVELVQEMNGDVTKSLKGYNQALGEETEARGKQNAAYAENKASEEAQIQQGKSDIMEAESTKAANTETMLSAEGEIKKLSKQLHDLVKYCETQALDWDKYSSKRQTDHHVLSVAINVLSCGSETCGPQPAADDGANVEEEGSAPPEVFLQAAAKAKKVAAKTGVSLRIKPTENSQKAVLRRLVALGEQKFGDKDLVLLQKYLTSRDPLMGAKKLIRNIIEKLTKEAALDQGEMNVCSTSLAECKTKRDFAIENAGKAKVALEELGQSMEEDKREFAQKSDEYVESYDSASEISHVDIPALIATYDSTKAQLTEEKTWLAQAILVLRKHFGVADNELAAGPKDASSGLENSPERNVGDAGDTQSTGASVVRMLGQNLAERKVELSELREAHQAELAGLRQQKSDMSATAAGAKARYEYLKREIEKETALFGESLLELQGKLDVAAANGRCVQELEPCGVQMDRRAQREQEIAALKDAWVILAEGTEAERPMEWGPEV